MTVKPIQHSLVPKHSKISDTEKKKLYETYGITSRELPKIISEDSAISKLGVKEGDIIKIERQSVTAGKAVYYRVVING